MPFDMLRRLLPHQVKSALKRVILGAEQPLTAPADPALSPVVVVPTPFSGSGRSHHGVRHLLGILGYRTDPFHVQKDSLLANPRYLREHDLDTLELAARHYQEVLSSLCWRARELGYGTYVQLHLPIATSELFADPGLKILYTMRDPRDMVTSTYFFYRHLYEQGTATNLPDLVSMFTEDSRKDEAITLLLEGRFHVVNADLFMHFLSPLELLRFTQEHRHRDNFHVLDFEPLHEQPLPTFTAVARFLEPPDRAGTLTPEDVEAAVHSGSIEHRSEGRTKPGQRSHYVQERSGAWIRKGVPGDWKNHFAESHKRLVKELAGDLLCEAGYETSLDW